MEQEKHHLSCVKEKKMLMAYELSQKKNAITNVTVKKLWLQWYPEDVEYFERLPYKWDDCYNWINKYLEKHDTTFILSAIQKQRAKQKRILDKKIKYVKKNAYVIMIKSQIKQNRLAKYLLIDGSTKRTGDYGSIVEYIKSLNKITK